MPRDIKAISILLLCLALLSGCALQADTPDAYASAVPVPQITPVQPKDIAQSTRPVASLYFYSPSKNALVVSARTLTASAERNKAYEILSELAAGPSDLSVEAVLPGGTAVEALEISQGVATVSFSSGFNALDEYGKFVARAAVTDTLMEVEGIQVVNILSGGRAMAFGGAPVGAMMRQYPRDLDLLYQKALRQITGEDARAAEQTGEDPSAGQQTQAGPDGAPDASVQPVQQGLPQSTVTRRMVLYFPDATQGLMLAEHREVTLNPNHVVEAVLKELMDGPASPGLTQGSLPAETALFRPPTQSQADGRYTLNLDFTAQFAAALAKRTPQQIKEAVASLVLSITAFVPQVDAVRLLVEGQPYTPVSLASGGGNAARQGYARGDFAPMVGNTVGLYFPTENQDAMHRIMRPVPQDTWHLASVRLSELANGEAGETEEDRVLAWPQPADEAGQPTVTNQVGDTVFVDLPQSFINTFSAMGAQQERMTVYCIVNTLVDTQGISRVRFQSDGKAIENWPGLLSINSAFVRNPGLIQE